jgi:hypothetical protein
MAFHFMRSFADMNAITLRFPVPIAQLFQLPRYRVLDIFSSCGLDFSGVILHSIIAEMTGTKQATYTLFYMRL